MPRTDISLNELMAERGIRRTGCTGVERGGKRLRNSNLAEKVFSNFTYLKVHLENRSTDLVTIFEDIFTETEIIQAGVFYNEIDKIDFLLKTVLRKTEEMQENFLQTLIDKHILQINDLQDFKIIHSDSIQAYKDFTVVDFEDDIFQRCLKQELEPGSIIDYMFERRLLDIDQHDDIKKNVTRNEQVSKILSILRQNDNSWLLKFCYILDKHHPSPIMSELRKLKHPSSNSPYTVDGIPSCGSTVKLETSQVTEQAILERPLDELAHMITSRNAGVLVHIQRGCIEFILLSPTSDGFHKQGDNEKEKICLTFVQDLIGLPSVRATIKSGQTFRIWVSNFDHIVPLLDKDGNKLQLQLEIALAIRINRSYFLSELEETYITDLLSQVDQTVGNKLSKIEDKKLKNEALLHYITTFDEANLSTILNKATYSENGKCFAETIQKWQCLECYRSSIISSYKEIIDEIDTDMMKRTFKDCQDCDFIKDICVEKTTNSPRSKRASTFLQFILMNGKALLSFADVFSRRSKVSIRYVPCLSCSGKEQYYLKSPSENPDFVFCVEEYNGHVKVNVDSRQTSPVYTSGQDCPVIRKSDDFTGETSRRMLLLENSAICN